MEAARGGVGADLHDIQNSVTIDAESSDIKMAEQILLTLEAQVLFLP